MKRIISYLAVAGVVALLAVPAHAVCGSARLFDTGDYYNFSILQTPGYVPTPGVSSSVSQNMTGSFWAIGSGNPAIGPGNDNGSFAALDGYYGWAFTPVYYGYAATFRSSWASNAGIDNCIDAGGNGCMAVLLSDQDSSGVGYFAYLTDEADSALNYRYTQAGNAPINLVQVPKLLITGSTNPGDGLSVDALVSLNIATTPENGFYLDPNCGTGAPVEYRVRQQTLTRGATPPSDRSAADWVDTGSVATIGETAAVAVSCSDNSDVYLAATIMFDSGFETTVVGPNSSRVECGPNLADPQQRTTPSRTDTPRKRTTR